VTDVSCQAKTRELLFLDSNEGEEKFKKQQSYLQTAVNLAERKALSRISYLVGHAAA
jgi:hypothetical protein